MDMIKATGLVCSHGHKGSRQCSLDDVSFSVAKGELVYVLGGSGSGKTSLVLSVIGLLPLQQGELSVSGLDCRDSENLWEIRKNCGLVFEEADDMFVSTYAHEDVAFAARNFYEDESAVDEKVCAALETVGLSGYENRPVQLLTGFEKKRLAIAGVLAYDPQIMIFDSVFSGIDHEERRYLNKLIESLRQKGKTIVVTSRNAQDAARADKVLILSEGKLLAEGVPGELLPDALLMEKAGLELPFAVRVYHDLLEAGAKIEKCPLDIDELVEEVCR